MFMAYFPCCNKNEIGKVSKMMLLQSVNVYKNDSADKDFTMFCDPTYVAIEEDDSSGKSQINPRHSWMEYKHATRHMICLGQILAIILYSTSNDDGSSKLHLGFLMLRVEVTQDKGMLPLPLYKYKKEEQDTKLYQIDPILHTDLLRPVFAISALCQNRVSFQRSSVESYSRFYIFGDEVSKCSHIHDYDYYSRMNLLRRRDNSFIQRGGSKCFHYNLYMSYEELMALKEDLLVSTKCVKVKKKKNDVSGETVANEKVVPKKRKVSNEQVESEDLEFDTSDDDDIEL